MKKFIYITFLAFALMLSACADLEEYPVGILSPDAYFNTKADGEAAIMGAYAGFAGMYDYGNDFSMTVGNIDDQQKCLYSGDHQNCDKIVPIVATNGKIYSIWKMMYKEICAANNAIEGIAIIPPDKISDADRAALTAEAKTIRAYNYFRLVRLFGAVPYIDYFITDPLAAGNLTRTPTATIWANIIADLEVSKDALPNKYDGSGSNYIRSRISKGSAYTILADVYLTRENWAQALANAKYVIDHKDDFEYDLLPDFNDLFKFYDGNDTKEYIWSCDFSSNSTGYDYGRDQLAELSSVPGSDWNGWGTTYTTPKALNEFQVGDYRRKITFFEEAPYGGVLIPWTEWTPNANPGVAKYFRSFIGTPKEKTAWITDMNFPIYRYAEVLLIAAEAECMANGATEEAYGYFNQIRARARNYDGVVGSSTIPADLTPGLTAAAFRDSVIKERKIELAFEFKRWFDIQRITNDTDKKLSIIFGSAESTDSLAQADLITQSYKLFPIPQQDINNNPNLALPVE
jgi:tetratricopeptide (TPR) repeat protein